MKLSNSLLKQNTILGGALICIAFLSVVFQFTSCENFLKATQIKSEIEEAIEIANSSPVTYYVIADNNSGTVTPTQLRLKKKEKFDVMFIPADGWQFVCWEVLDRITNEPVTDSIKFNEPEKLETKGSVLEAKENLVIHPKCRLVPKVSSITPIFESYGCNQDTTIVVKFNKPMDPATFGDFSCVTITCSEMPLYTSTLKNAYFQKPVFSPDKTELLIPTVKGKFILPESSTKSLLDINLDIDLSAVKDMDGNSISENISYTYRINKNKDGDAPRVMKLNLFKPIMNKSDETGEYTPLSDIPISEFSNSNNYDENTYVQNHVGSKIYFDTTVIDDDSGFMQLTIEETLKATVDAASASLPSKISKPYKSSSFKDNELLGASYEFQSEYDGLIKLDFIFVDYANNETRLTRYVVKDTTLAAAQVINPDSVDFYAKSGQTMNNTQGNSQTNGFYVQLRDDTVQAITEHTPVNGMITDTLDFSKSYDIFYFGSTNQRKSIVTYDIKYGYSESSIDIPATKVSDTIFTITRNASKDCYLKMTAWDDVGNSNSILRIIPRQVSIVSMVKSPEGTTNTYYTFSISNEDALSSLASQYSAQKSTFVVLYKFKPKNSSTISDYYCATIDKSLATFIIPDSTKFYLKTSQFADDTLTPDGTYYFYVLPVFKYGRDIWFTGAVSTEAYVFHHNDGTGSSSPGYASFGDFTVTEVAKEQNTGVHEYSVTKNWTQTSGWTYGICYNETGKTDYKYADLNFSVPSGHNYKLCIYAKNNTTGTIQLGSVTKTIDATYDNIPPVIIPSYDVSTDYDVLQCAPNQILLGPGFYPQDIGGAGLPEEEEDYEYFSYYILKKETTGAVQSIANTITLDDLEDLDPEWGYVHNKCINLPFEKFIEHAYTIVFNLEDNNENSSLHSFTIYNKTNNEIPVPDKYNGFLYFSKSSNSNPKNTMTYAFGYYYDNDGLWKKIRGTSDTFPNSPTNYYSSLTDKFVKFTEFDGQNYIYSMTCFYSSDYLNKLTSASPYTCNSKGVVPGYGNNIQIFYDAPYFVHTMKYPKSKVSELETKARNVFWSNNVTLDEALAYVWATKGIEIDCEYVSKPFDGELKSSTYTIKNPYDSLYAYAAVVHFADGTTMMSDIKNKE